jgi:cytochrome c-type biogenesis protein CcmE
MNAKILLAVVVIVAGLIVGVVNFLESNVEYGDFTMAERVERTVQVKGEWVKEAQTRFDAQKGQFLFSMRDENGRVMPVVLAGAKPNNFEIATSIVAKGRLDNGVFYASNVLTKCPSKYEGDAAAVKESL